MTAEPNSNRQQPASGAATVAGNAEPRASGVVSGPNRIQPLTPVAAPALPVTAAAPSSGPWGLAVTVSVPAAGTARYSA